MARGAGVVALCRDAMVVALCRDAMYVRPESFGQECPGIRFAV
ncbi:hypothetical protein [Streptomyces sp. NBC_00829]|nr:hypothetical protein OG293_21210 [Streptomyces sp. NBC_00829]